MSFEWGEDPYNNPQKFGLEIVGQLDDPEACWSFDYLVVWRDLLTSRLMWATDSGCSCPSPFESLGLPDLTPITEASWPEFEEAVKDHASPYYDTDTGRGSAEFKVEKVELLAKVRKLMRAGA